MSNAVSTLVYSRLVGSMARKAVLGYFADRASDDGTGIWTGKQRIADEIECSKQTVITVIRGLVADGLVEEVGERRCGNGYTIEYRMILTAIAALPVARPDGEGVQIATGPKLDPSSHLTPRGQVALPKPPLNHQTPEDAYASSAPGVKKRASRMRSDWQAPAVEDLPEPARSIARQWPPGAYATLAAGHREYCLSTGRRSKDHDAGWVARIIALGASPIRDGKAGLRFTDPRGGSTSRTGDRDPAAYERTAAMFDKMGRADDAAAMRRLAAGG